LNFDSVLFRVYVSSCFSILWRARNIRLNLGNFSSHACVFSKLDRVLWRTVPKAEWFHLGVTAPKKLEHTHKHANYVGSTRLCVEVSNWIDSWFLLCILWLGLIMSLNITKLRYTAMIYIVLSPLTHKFLWTIICRNSIFITSLPFLLQDAWWILARISLIEGCEKLHKCIFYCLFVLNMLLLRFWNILEKSYVNCHHKCIWLLFQLFHTREEFLIEERDSLLLSSLNKISGSIFDTSEYSYKELQIIDEESDNTRIHFYLWWNEFLWISKTWATTGVFVCHTVLPLRNAISGPNNFCPGLSHQLSKESHWWHSFLSCAWDLLHLDIQMCALMACEICWSLWHFCCHWLFVPMCFQSCGQVHSTNSLLLSCEISMGKFSCAQWISFNGWVKCALTLLKLNSGQWLCTCCQNRHHLNQAMLQMRIINCVYNIDVYWKYLWIFLTFFSCW